jgi:hypothetical protein
MVILVVDAPLDDGRVLVGVDEVTNLVDRTGDRLGTRCLDRPAPLRLLEGVEARQLILRNVAEDEGPVKRGLSFQFAGGLIT